MPDPDFARTLRLQSRMAYQLVIKFWRASLEDETFLTTIESELKGVLGEAVFDGYDVSEEEINMFVITPDPKHSFRRVKSVLEKRASLRGVSAAFRLVGGAQFTLVWPTRPMRKFKLP
jgi:hypothetical protein